MLSAVATNLISATNPNEYLPQCASHLGSSADVVFASNLLPQTSVFDYSRASYDKFLAARAKLVTEAAQSLCNGLEHPLTCSPEAKPRGSFKTTVNGRSMHRGAAGPSEFVVFSKGGDSAQVQKEQPVGF
jgi:hypothetical protein